MLLTEVSSASCMLLANEREGSNRHLAKGIALRKLK
jgi:hypothetical protein